MRNNDTDTICAPASPPGSGAIAVIRLSGSNAFDICSKIFDPANKELDVSKPKPNSIHFGTIVDKGEIVDEVLVSFFKAPHSYTGENAVEISCHGSVYIQQRIIEMLLKNGARMADAGEFSMRAFLHGKFDLSQAEAVADLIASESKSAHRIAMQQLRGTYSNKIKELRSSLLNFASLIELELDFAEEDVEFADRREFIELVKTIKAEIERLIHSFKVGNVLKEGIPVAIAGKPNVGKSTLLNALLQEDKAIVSDIPGTTRDVIEDRINLQGTLFRFIDTAGIRQSSDTIEKLGIERTYDQIKKASIILYLIENKNDINTDDIRREMLDAGIDLDNTEQKLIVLLNKSDLIENQINSDDKLQIISISAKEHMGIQELEEALLDYVRSFDIQSGSIVTNARHIQAFENANAALERVLQAFEADIPTDLVAIDVRDALYHLGSITGEITTDELLGNIFGKFCIGK